MQEGGATLSLWLLLWFVLSFILLGATFWSTIILVQQKKAWGEYAKKKGLTFARGTFFAPCTMEGIVDGYNVSFFSATQQNVDARKNRELTVMQVNASDPFVDGIACGTPEMLPFLQSLDTTMPHELKTGKWNKENQLRSRNKKAVDAYLTEDRIKIINGILSMPNADVVILLDNNEGIFRFETSNPLTDANQIDATVNKLIARIKKLTPSEEERKKLTAMEASEEKAEPVVKEHENQQEEVVEAPKEEKIEEPKGTETEKPKDQESSE